MNGPTFARRSAARCPRPQSRAVLPLLPVLLSASPEVPYERYKLPNGLTVILHEEHALPTVVVDLWFRVGSKDERPKRTGFAHLFEHLMFMGTKNVPEGRFDALMEAEGGVNNAGTSEDRTTYFEAGPSGLLELFLWLEADRLSTLPDAMTAAKLDLQRNVVKNERRQTMENQPYGKVELVLPEKLYPPGHPYHHPVIGSHEDLGAATVEDVKAFFRAHYVPSNASLVIAGDFDPLRARALVEKYFAWMPAVPEPLHTVPPPARLAKPEVVTIPEDVELEQVTLAWHSPAWFAAGDAEATLLAAILGAGKASRLSSALVDEQRIAESVEVEQRALLYGGNFVIVATGRGGVTARALEAAVDAELAKLASAPPTDREVARAKAAVTVEALHALETPLGRAEALSMFEERFGDPGQLERSLLARFTRITAGDVAYQAKAILGAPRVTVRVVRRAKR